MKMTKRTGGPRTVAGKKAASRNALKTGTYSSVVVLPGEDEAEYKQLEEQFISDFAPQDIAEIIVVRELAVVVWKKLRLERLEKSAFLKALNDYIDDEDYRRHGVGIWSKTRWLVDQLNRVTKDYVKFHKTIAEEVAPYLNKELALSDIETISLMCPVLYQEILNQAEVDGVFLDKEPTVTELAQLLITNAKGDLELFAQEAIKHAAEIAEQVLWVSDRKERLLAAKVSIQEKRLMNLMALDAPRRVYDDLDRIFFKKLAELRKHQEWRQERNTLDITPEQQRKLQP